MTFFKRATNGVLLFLLAPILVVAVIVQMIFKKARML